MGAAGWTLDLTATAISDEVCFQVTTRGDRPWIAEVLGGETRQKQAAIRVGSETLHSVFTVQKRTTPHEDGLKRLLPGSAVS